MCHDEYIDVIIHRYANTGMINMKNEYTDYMNAIDADLFDADLYEIDAQ